MGGKSKGRSAGSPWRVLVHSRDGEVSHHVASEKRFGGALPANIEGAQQIELPDTVLDEVVVSGWFHLEQMDKRKWWMEIGGVVLWVETTRDGRPKSVRVYGPGEHAEPVDGCEYKLTWGAEEAAPAGEAHAYVSTACQHGLHGRCRRTCKFCGTACQCADPECTHPRPEASVAEEQVDG